MNVSNGFQPMEWVDYSGGFTDNVYSDELNKCARNNNLLIDRNRKTYLRPGSNLYWPSNPQHPNGTNRINRFLKFPDETSLFAISGPTLAYDNTSSAFIALTGPTGHDAFHSLDTTYHYSWAYWNNQYFITQDGGAPVIRVYKDNSGNWKLIQGGLPALDNTQYSSSSSTAQANAITLANAILVEMLNHFADVTAHGTATAGTHIAADTVSTALAGGGASNLPTLLALTGRLLQAYQNHFNDSQSGVAYHRKEIPESSWPAGVATPVASLASRTLVDTSVPTTLVDAITRLNDIKKCYNSHEGRVDSHGDPQNVYLNPVTTAFIYNFVQGPLISFDPTFFYTYANKVKTQINGHLGYTGANSYAHVSADTTNPITVANATTPETLEALIWYGQICYTGHDLDARKNAAWAYHRGKENPLNPLNPDNPGLGNPIGTPPYPDEWGGLRAGNWSEMAAMLNQFKTVINSHMNDTNAHHLPVDGTPNKFQIPGSTQDIALANYIYAFHYDYQFTVGTIQNEIVGPVLEVPAFGVVSTKLQSLQISNLPVLSNTLVQNYDTSNITIQIYRTTDGGNTFYLVGSVTNGTTTFTDFVTDDELIGRQPIYITGGLVDHDPVPLANCVHITNSTGYYGGITDAGEYFPNRVRQSIQGAPDACPGGFFDDMEDTVVGISSVKTLPIVGCTHSFYRLDGAFTENGAGLITHQAISNTVGLLSEASLVRVDNGVFFAGTDGFYFTDGYQLKKLSDNWNTTYAALTSTTEKAKRIQGAYDNLTRRVWWAVQFDSTLTDNDSFVVLDLNFGLETPCWTQAANTGHFFPTACIFYKHFLIRGHSQGYIFQHFDNVTYDPYINTSVTPSLWGTKTILFDWKSTFVSWGTTNVRKWCPMIEFNLQNDTNINVQVNGFNDNDRSNHVFSPMKFHSHYVWGDETLVWGDDLLLWNYHGNIDDKRYVPAGSLRCTYKQIEFTNAYVTIQSSQDKGTATVSSGAKTVTLDTGSKYWPLDPEGYFISFANDNYATSYEIVKKNSTTLPTVLTVTDPGSTLASGSYAWKISGYQKGQVLHLLDCTLWGRPMSLSQTGNRE